MLIKDEPQSSTVPCTDFCKCHLHTFLFLVDIFLDAEGVKTVFLSLLKEELHNITVFATSP